MRCKACNCKITTLSIDTDLCMYCLGESFKKVNILDKQYTHHTTETPFYEVIEENREILLDI